MAEINFKKVIIAGLVVDILSFVLPFISYNLFSWIFELEPTSNGFGKIIKGRKLYLFKNSKMKL